MLPTSKLLLIALAMQATLAEQHSSTTSTTSETQNTAEKQQQQQQQQQATFLDEKYQDLRMREPSYLSSDRRFLLSDDTDQLTKRASMRGFQGMRGKKNNDLYYAEPGNYYDYYYDDTKRAPSMGFHGMRGKKADDNFLDEFDEDGNPFDKRAPNMGFQGMRGKKSLEEVLDELERKRAMLGFQGMRGKKSEEYEDDQFDGQWHKRAPSMGFQGMRGRKSSGFLDQLDELEKRALLGFHGMRGKKEMLYEQENSPMNVEGYMEKRPMMMGFHGMRGKRSANYYGGRYEKRSPYRYYGSRGKKNPRWELRGKFVGVRGKKWTESPRPALNIFDQLSLVNTERMAASRH